jgi:hypothetical protein
MLPAMLNSIWVALLLSAATSKIAEVKQVYAFNQSHRANWKKQTKSWGDCGPSPDTGRTLISDAKGAPRIYIFSGGSDDSAFTAELHYDDDVKLRFVLIQSRASGGSQLERRIYYDKLARRLREIQKRKGPGHLFPDPWPDDEPIDAKAAFEADHVCTGQ